MILYELGWMMLYLAIFSSFIGICVAINYAICESHKRKKQRLKSEMRRQKDEANKKLFYENERQISAWRNKK